MDELDRIELLEPWYKCPHGLENQLRKEMSETHALFNVEAISVARRQDNDDVLFYLPNYEKQFVVVHLTWGGKQNNRLYPHTNFFASMKDWVENCMNLDHKEFENYS